MDRCLVTGRFGHSLKFFLNDQKKLSQFGHDVSKYRLANAVTASFNSIMGQNILATQHNIQVEATTRNIVMYELQ